MTESLRSERRGLFFQVFATVLLVFVFLGFSRTLYLRPWFSSEPMPAYLYVHGFVLTAWFLFFLAQSLLIARHRLMTHRRAGAIGVVLAVLVLVVSLITVFGIVGRLRSLGMDVEAERAQISFIVWGDIGALIAFSVFIARAVIKRNIAASHKRLMLLGSISLMAPAFIRVSAIPPFDQLGGVAFTLGALLAAAGMLIIYDFLTLKRVHWETLWGVPFFFVMLLGMAFLVPGTEFDAWLLSKL